MQSPAKTAAIRKNLGTLRTGYSDWFPCGEREVNAAASPARPAWPNDPLGYAEELPLSAAFHPLGYPVELSTNSAEVLRAAEESWSGFPQLFCERPLEIRVAVSDNGAAASASEFQIRGQRHVLGIVSDARNFAICDTSKGFAYGWVTAATAADRPWFRYMYLDTIVNMILWQTHLTRIHAGCVAFEGRGVLLCGESGAGKSCLTYACARRGWTFISDEAPSILRRTEERIVIGKPHLIHFRETAFELFPELNGREAKPNIVGKISLEVRTAELPQIRTAYTSGVAAIVFLNRRHEGPATLVPLSKEEVWRRLSADLPMFEERAHEEHIASLRNLLGAETYELRYRDFGSAIDVLEDMARKGGEL